MAYTAVVTDPKIAIYSEERFLLGPFIWAFKGKPCSGWQSACPSIPAEGAFTPASLVREYVYTL